MHKKTITLCEPMPFHEALSKLINGECLGIRPVTNTSYIVKHKPNWMSPTSADFCLAWNSSNEIAEIRSNQYMGEWFLVIIDHREL